MTAEQEVASRKCSLRVRVREFAVPPIHDCLILGRASPIGCVAIRKAISLMIASPFAHIEVSDDVVSDILVRESMLKRVPRDQLVDFVMTQVKPLMQEDEILHLDIEPEVILEARYE